MLDEGVWAEVKVGNEHLRLFAEHNAQGVQASVYNVISKTWIAPSESVVDLEEGKERAEVHAREYLKRVANQFKISDVTRMPSQASLRKPFFCDRCLARFISPIDQTDFLWTGQLLAARKSLYRIPKRPGNSNVQAAIFAKLTR